MTRRSLLLCVVFAAAAPLSSGCHAWRPLNCSGGGCYSKGLTPPGANTAGYYGPILNRPVINRPVINRPVVNFPILNRPVLFPGVAAGFGGDAPPVYADPHTAGPVFDGAGPGCATCGSSPAPVGLPPGGPVAMGGMPDGLIASTGQPVPMLTYGPLPAEYTTVPPPAFAGQPSTVLPAPKVVPMTETPNGGGAPSPMPPAGGQK